MNAVADFVNLFTASVYDVMDGVAGVLTKFSFFHIIGSLIGFLFPLAALKAKPVAGWQIQPASLWDDFVRTAGKNCKTGPYRTDNAAIKDRIGCAQAFNQ